jgi:Ser/Thr protein kinase RdoA (MazF antagonist)
VTRNQVQASVERAYGLRVLRPLNDLPPGVHSQAWLAHTDDGEWVVKVSDPRSDSPAMLSAQCELYGFLNGRGLHAPEVRADRSGRHVSALAEPDAGLPVTLMRHHEFHRLTPGVWFGRGPAARGNSDRPTAPHDGRIREEG